MDNTIQSWSRDERLASLFLVSLDILHPIQSPSASKSRRITLLFLLLELLLPAFSTFLERSLPHWLCICMVLASVSYTGNVDRRWWLYALTAAALSPIAYKAFWPLRDLCRDDERVAEVTLTANSLILAAVLMLSGMYTAVTCVFVPKTEARAVLPRPAALEKSSELADEPPTPPRVVHFARRPSWLIKSRPSALKLSQYPARNANASDGPIDKQQEGRSKETTSTTKPKRRRGRSHAMLMDLLDSSADRPDNFDEDYDVTPGYQANAPSSPVEPLIQEDMMDITTPSTPAWAKVDRMPPTPLSAARLEHFVAPKGPAPRVIAVQVMASWTPIGDWLCDPEADADEKWKKVRRTIDSWQETCKRSSTKRIARYSIGTSADTTEIVLGPMHLSMHDVLDFFEQTLHEQGRPRDATKDLERLNEGCVKTLGSVAIELVHMARDYPRNHLIAMMARLAAKTTRAAEWRRRTLEWYATEGDAVRSDSVEPEGLSGDPGDPTTKAKHDFMTKILKLGHEAQDRETAWAARDLVALKKAGLVDAGQYERESQRRQAAQASKSDGAHEVVDFSGKVFNQRLRPWVGTVFEPTPDGLAAVEWQRALATKLPFETVEEAIDKPHASKSRRREGRSEDDRLLDCPADEAPSQRKRDTDGKRVLSDTNVEVEESRKVVYRAKIKRPGRKITERKITEEAKRALEAGELSGFDKFVAENRLAMAAMMAGPPGSKMVPEMADEIAAAEGVMDTGADAAQQSLQEVPAAAALGAGGTAGQAQSTDRDPPPAIDVFAPPDGDGADQGPAVSDTLAPRKQSTWKPPPPAVEDAEDSDEEL